MIQVAHRWPRWPTDGSGDLQMAKVAYRWPRWSRDDSGGPEMALVAQSGSGGPWMNAGNGEELQSSRPGRSGRALSSRHTTQSLKDPAIESERELETNPGDASDRHGLRRDPGKGDFLSTL